MWNHLRVIATGALRYIVKLAGGVVLSKRAFELLCTQRNRAVSKLISLENCKLEPGLTGVVFSKDRALQLYTLLHSYFRLVENPAPLFIIYDVTTDGHAKAYRQIEDTLENSVVKVTFIREKSNFCHVLQDILSKIHTKNVFFLVDDIVFIRKIDLRLASAIDPFQTILSLRHSPHLRRSYTAGVDQNPPNFTPYQENSGLVCFEWFEQGNEWSDPWSVDGQVLSTAEVRILTLVSDFKAPNTYEAALKTFNDIVKGRNGMCYTESKILNLPINRVQDETENYSGNISTEYLLKQWNKGLMLDLSLLDDHIPQSPHEELPVKFVSRQSFPIT